MLVTNLVGSVSGFSYLLSWSWYEQPGSYTFAGFQTDHTSQILTGVLRHYATVLMASTPKRQEAPAIREQRSLLRGVHLRANANQISPASFEARKAYITSAFQSGAFLKEPDRKGQPPANPMSDPAAMEGMMGMMKNNMAMMIPQTLIMGWINAFFSGFVVLKLPFPLTPKFKSMLQSGVATRDLDVRWVSSISLYFICLFGLQPVFIYLLGSDNGKSCAYTFNCKINTLFSRQPSIAADGPNGPWRCTESVRSRC